MNTKQTGDISVAAAMQAIIKLGKSISIPFGDRDRYDLIIDDGERLEKIQVKTGWEDRGCIRFSAKSVSTDNGEWVHRGYKGQIDAFIVYYPPTGQIYKIPIDKCRSLDPRLRITPTKNNQSKKILFAKDFEFK